VIRTGAHGARVVSSEVGFIARDSLRTRPHMACLQSTALRLRGNSTNRRRIDMNLRLECLAVSASHSRDSPSSSRTPGGFDKYDVYV
jgi:hypothetical protein